MYRTTLWVSLDIMVGTVTNCKQHNERNHGSIIKGFSYPSKRPHRLWNSSSFLFNGHAGFICRVLNRLKLATHIYLVFRYKMRETIPPLPNILPSIPSRRAKGQIYFTFILARQLIKMKTFGQVFIVIARTIILNVNGKYSINAIRKVSYL
jgi:hypothetical protein